MSTMRHRIAPHTAREDHAAKARVNGRPRLATTMENCPQLVEPAEAMFIIARLSAGSKGLSKALEQSQMIRKKGFSARLYIYMFVAQQVTVIMHRPLYDFHLTVFWIAGSTWAKLTIRSGFAEVARVRHLLLMQPQIGSDHFLI